MKRDENASKEKLVFLLERKGEAVDDGAQDLEQLGDAVESFGLVYELEEDVVDRTTDVGSQVQKLPIDAMQGRFQEVSFPWIFRVKKLQKLPKRSVRSTGATAGQSPTWRTN